VFLECGPVDAFQHWHTRAHQQQEPLDEMVHGGLLAGRDIDDDIRDRDGLDHRKQVALGANGIAVRRIPKHNLRGQGVRNKQTHAIPVERSPRKIGLLMPTQPAKRITVTMK
jgi:hypothetical protein